MSPLAIGLVVLLVAVAALLLLRRRPADTAPAPVARVGTHPPGAAPAAQPTSAEPARSAGALSQASMAVPPQVLLTMPIGTPSLLKRSRAKK